MAIKIYSSYISTIVVLLLLCTLTQAVDRLPRAVIADMASREMRHHHLLWHNVRAAWNTLDSATQQDLERLGWGVPRPSEKVNEAGVTVAIDDNNAGEDFLYMHRQMLLRAQRIASNLNPPLKIVGWETIPDPEDPRYPVPPVYDAENNQTSSSVVAWKSNDTYWNVIKTKEAKFKSPRYLKNVTLGQLGTRIEYELHTGLHIRWSERTAHGLRPRPANPVPLVDAKWDETAYDWLIDSYSSHVNPYFFNLHLWIDDRIQDWMNANNVTELQWKGTWVGGPMSRVSDLVQVGKNHHLKVDGAEIPAPSLRGAHDMEHDMHKSEEQEGGVTVNVMEEVMEILAKAGVKGYSFYDRDGVKCEGGEDLPEYFDEEKNE